MVQWFKTIFKLIFFEMLDSSKTCQNSLCLQEEVSLALCSQPPAERDSLPTLDLPRVWGKLDTGGQSQHPAMQRRQRVHTL